MFKVIYHYTESISSGEFFYLDFYLLKKLISKNINLE